MFVVTNTNDSGPGSLRQAMLDANTDSVDDAIHFSIGSGHQTITPISPLPILSAPATITLDARTQPGYSGRPLIELDGSNAGSPANGLTSLSGLIVRGFVINRFAGDGIRLIASGGIIQGNYIGTNFEGTAASPNLRHGVWMSDSSASTIGGPASPLGSYPGNVISGNGQDGIQLYDFSGNNTNNGTVQGNLIGTDSTGAFRVGNGRYGVFIAGSAGNRIGGSNPNEGNVISANGTGVRIGGLELQVTFLNRVEANLIGTNPNGANLGNTGHGILFATLIGGSRVFNNVVGGSGAASNTIAFNGGDGVALTPDGTGNSIRENHIFSNGGLGIDLGDDGVTANDTFDVDAGPNLLQNFPILTSAVSAGAVTTVQGGLHSVPFTTFAVEIFANAECDPSGSGEGQLLLGSAQVTTGGGNAIFSASVGFVSVGTFLTATATDPNGNTSEFSACILVGAPTPTPTPTATPTATPTVTPSPNPTATATPAVAPTVPTLSPLGFSLLVLLLAALGSLLAANRL